MKFGKQLEENAVRRYLPHYLDYTKLKKLLKLEKSSTATATAEAVMASRVMERRTVMPNTMSAVQAKPQQNINLAEVSFMKAVERELERVNAFAVAKAKELRTSLVDTLAKLERDGSHSSLTLYDGLADEVREELVMLDRFVRHNTTGFRKIMKKHDKVTQNMASSWFLPRLAQQRFNNLDFDSMLVLLSDTYVRLRTLKDASSSTKPSTWVPPESFERKTTKYWIREDDLMTIKTSTIKNLPLLIFGRKQGEAPPEVKERDMQNQPMTLSSLTAKGNEAQVKESDASLITSVYFDNDEVEMYTRRIHQEEGNMLVRIRWYGDLTSDNSEAFVERKTHHESWVLEDSVKERFNLKRKHIVPYLKGEWTPDKKLDKLVALGKLQPEKAKKQKELAANIFALIQEKKLRPFVRTVYRRSAYQLASTNEVRISLDTDLFMVNERVDGDKFKQMLDEGRWCADLSATISPSDVIAFPFAVFEVKLQSEQPAWISDIVDGDSATEIWKFSKFQHGIGMLHSSRTSVLPHWLDKVDEIAGDTLDEDTKIERINSLKQTSSPRRVSLSSKGGGSEGRLLKGEVEEESESAVHASDVAKRVEEEERKSRGGRDSIEEVTSPSLPSHRDRSSPPRGESVDHIHVNFGDTDDLIVDDFKARGRGKSFKRFVHNLKAKAKRRFSSLSKRGRSKTEGDIEMGTAGSRGASMTSPFSGGIFDAKGKKIEAKKPMKIEPKTFFANERTLLQWLNTAVVISLIGVNLMALGSVPSLVFGALMSCVSVAFIIYALMVYRKRARSIASREPIRYDDRVGPYVLVPALILTILLSVAFTIGYSAGGGGKVTPVV
mmetsp:Transcript_18974/g.48381  ORF Transcript_18974/g.48381 Transcript_18974/m.48381 type:complete len:836 (-) Transcript_18974:175-2682(-)